MFEDIVPARCDGEGWETGMDFDTMKGESLQDCMERDNGEREEKFEDVPCHSGVPSGPHLFVYDPYMMRKEVYLPEYRRPGITKNLRLCGVSMTEMR